MFIIIFATVIGAVMAGVKYKEAVKYKETIQNAITNRKFEEFNYSKVVRLIYVLLILFGLGSAVYGAMEQSDETIAMGIVTALLFVGELLVAPYKYVLYYNNSQFITKGEVLRLKSIKHFERILNLKFAFVKVVMLNGDKYPISPKAYEILDKKLTEVRNK